MYFQQEGESGTTQLEQIVGEQASREELAMDVTAYDLRLKELKDLRRKLASIEQKIKTLEAELARRSTKQHGREEGHRPSQSG